MAPGDAVECLDGQGSAYRGVIEAVAKDQVLIKINQTLEQPERRRLVSLVVALIKPVHFEWLIQKATELGVKEIIPLATERTVIRLMPQQHMHRQQRWQRIAQEAAKQCGRADIPEIQAIETLDTVFARLTGQRVLILTLAVKGQSIYQVFGQGQPQDLAVFIGPEGDFTDQEVRLAVERGAEPIYLKTHTLRSETAAIALLSIAQYVAHAF
jgi:16S rRNA (uracil1498-N3)-methyltransferase